MEALGPVVADDPVAAPDERVFLELESQGVVLRTRIGGRTAWCDRRLLARIHRYTLDRLRREIEPVSSAQFLRFLACWQHVDPAHRLDGPRGVAEAVAQLAGFEAPAAAWEGSILPARVRGYRREWLDTVTSSGEAAWGRFWGAGAGPIRRTPISIVRREDLESWAALADDGSVPRDPGRTAREVHEALQTRGAMFVGELTRATAFSKSLVEEGLAELVALGMVTCDSFAGLRWLLVPASRRRIGELPAGRWTVLRRDALSGASAEFVARRLLHRTGVVFRRTLARERQPLPWRDVARACRRLEAKGEVRGGRFVAGFDGEQYALPDAVALLREVRRRGSSEPNAPPLVVSAADPLNFRGILTPDDRVPSTTSRQVRVA
jgi:ATP-dependent Lhr-like helicase